MREVEPNRPMATVRVSGEDVPASLFWSGLLVILLGVAGFWVLAQNLGSGEAELDDVRAQARSFAEYLADGDGERACAMMEPAAAGAFAEAAMPALVGTPADCVELVVALASARDPQQSTFLRGVPFAEVRIVDVGPELNSFPDRAEVDVSGRTAVLSRVQGCAGAPRCWLVRDGGPPIEFAIPAQPGAPSGARP